MKDFGYELRKLAMLKYENLMVRCICPICGEPVEADDNITVSTNGEYMTVPNATCMVHGRVIMPLAGFVNR
jgi:hypothetical protein